MRGTAGITQHDKSAGHRFRALFVTDMPQAGLPSVRYTAHLLEQRVPLLVDYLAGLAQGRSFYLFAA